MTTVEDLLSGGSPSASFPTVGTTVKGTVESIEVVQQTDFTTGAPLAWDDGNPKMQWIVTLVTDDRNPEDPNDAGHRNLYVKGQMMTAVKEAIRSSGAKGDVRGGTLAVKYESDGEQKRAGFNPPKLYAAQFRAAAPSNVTAEELI